MREPSVTLRFAAPDDAGAIVSLAALDSAPVPAGPILLAEVRAVPRAAISLRDGSVIADPFHPSVELVELLRARTHQLGGIQRRRRLQWLRLRSRSARTQRVRPTASLR